MSRLPSILHPTEEDIQLLLSAQCHIGTKNVDINMLPYVYKRRADGIHIINIGKTWEKLILAARVLAAIENPQDIVVISARAYGQRAALKFASYTGAQAIAGRFTPGSFTNYITRAFKEPRVIVVIDPRSDSQAIVEAAYVNIPVIALCDTDSPLRYVDVAIPTNNKAKHAIGLNLWLLARAILRLRGTLDYTTPWDVMVDMFFFRDAEDRAEEAKAIETKDEAGGGGWSAAENADWMAEGATAVGGVDPSLAAVAATGDWGAPETTGSSWADESAASPWDA